jgi:hypothetical protein
MPESEQISHPEGGTHQGKEPRPRSGYARLRSRHNALIKAHERLTADHERLQGDYAVLEQAFVELKGLNASLVSDLRAARQSAPSGLPSFLMGQPYSR